MTAEDPVEFNLPGINQVQMKEQIGLNFAATLRSFLRQDPNIILVGEIRDFETAEVAIKAAMTGHLVLSTLHTNDAPSTISRLMNMGVEPFLVATSVHLVVAQRLVRRICNGCKEPIEIPLAGSDRGRLQRAGGAPAAPVQGARLRSLQQHRLQGARRPLRGDAARRRDARDGARRRQRLRAAATGHPEGDDQPARQRPREDPPGDDHGGRGRPRDGRLSHRRAAPRPARLVTTSPAPCAIDERQRSLTGPAARRRILPA